MGIGNELRVRSLFEVLDKDNDGRVDALSLLAGVALAGRGSFDAKARFLFGLFDFNLNASLSTTELAIMLQSTADGIRALCEPGPANRQDPNGDEVEAAAAYIDGLVEDAFQRCVAVLRQRPPASAPAPATPPPAPPDRPPRLSLLRYDANDSQSIAYDEYLKWARSNPDVIAALEAVGGAADDARGLYAATEGGVGGDGAADEQSDCEGDEADDAAVLEELQPELDIAAHVDRQSAAVARLLQDGAAAAADPPPSAAATAWPATAAAEDGSWKGGAVRPPSTENHRSSSATPSANLDLQWVHGWRSADARHGARYVKRRRCRRRRCYCCCCARYSCCCAYCARPAYILLLLLLLPLLLLAN